MDGGPNVYKEETTKKRGERREKPAGEADAAYIAGIQPTCEQGICAGLLVACHRYCSFSAPVVFAQQENGAGEFLLTLSSVTALER